VTGRAIAYGNGRLQRLLSLPPCRPQGGEGFNLVSFQPTKVGLTCSNQFRIADLVGIPSFVSILGG
jgi:hypothetical protein